MPALACGFSEGFWPGYQEMKVGLYARVSTHEQQTLALQQTAQLMELLQQNTELTRLTQQLSQRIEALTVEVHRRFVRDDG